MREWIVYGSELSPFTLKALLLCQRAGLEHRFFPTEGGLLENLRIQRRLRRLQTGRLALTWPRMSEEDEFPLVPYLFGPAGENLYDSTSIAHWLDEHILPSGAAFIPKDPAAAFLTRLIDDYADEFGLYLVHHGRWKISAQSNNAGQRLAAEWRSMLGPLQRPFAAWFSSRQVRRLPYLFSVAPKGFRIDGLPRRRQPPALAGFPPTHDLLEQALARLLSILEDLLQTRPYLLGGRLTLADTALYGQLAINLDDPCAAVLIAEKAPTLSQWLIDLRHAKPPEGDGQLKLDDALRPLLAEICRTHVPLMQQNLEAYEAWRAEGETCFNESAFNRRRALYEAELDGQRYRHVAKSFQAKVWRECLQHWQTLPAEARAELSALLPASHGIGEGAVDVKLIRS